MIKKIILSVLLSFVMSGTWAQQFSIHVGTGASYALLLNSGGINARALFGFRNQIRIEPEYTKYLKISAVEGYQKVEISAWSTGLNVNWMIETADFSSVYFIAGYHYQVESIRGLTNGNERIEDAGGAKVGLGLQLTFKRTSVFFDYSYISNMGSDHLLSTGMLFSIGKKG